MFGSLKLNKVVDNTEHKLVLLLGDGLVHGGHRVVRKDRWILDCHCYGGKTKSISRKIQKI